MKKMMKKNSVPLIYTIVLVLLKDRHQAFLGLVNLKWSSKLFKVVITPSGLYFYTGLFFKTK
jgi:hypothetical protein